MKIKNIKEMIRQSILAEYNMNEDYDVETGNSDVGLRDEYDNTVEEGSIDENAPTKDAIQRKYNEMFGKNPQTKFLDVAKALGTTEPIIAMTLMGFDLNKIKQTRLEEAERMDSETKEILDSLEDLRAQIDDKKFETLLNNVLTMVRQHMQGDRKLDLKALKNTIKKGDFDAFAKFQRSVTEAKDEEEEVTDEETVDIEAPAPDVPADMSADTTMVDEPTYTPEEAAVMSDLDDALKKSQGLGDEILSDLIGNIITYFTRQHVVKEVEAGKKKHYRGAVKDDEDQISKLKKDMKFDKKQLKTESLEMLKMRKLAGLLKEGEYAKALLKEEDSDVYMSFDKEKWFDKEDKPYAGSFDFDYDEETFDDFDSFISKYGDKQKSFKPAGKSMFDMYKNKYNNMMVRKRK
jgi:hypothetical protein